MGSAQSRKPVPIPDDTIRQLAATTHYDETELRELMRQFLAEAPGGYVDRVEFSVLAGMMGIQDADVTSLIFRAFDKNRDGMVTFGEFVTGMSVMTRGGPEEKLSFAFSLLDTRGIGYISKSDLIPVVAAIQRANMGELVSYQGEEYDNAVAYVDILFKDMGIHGNEMTLEQYKVGALRNPSIVQALALY
eukprot:PhF_6_TR23927/c0_g1_i1/m.33487/K19932/NCS1; neuronal calcium sensor 1